MRTQTTEYETTQAQRKAARIAAGLHPRDTRPVDVVPGDRRPREEGESYYFTTPSGKTRVRYPNAYKWPTMYWPSTRRVIVGQEWLEKHAPAE